jgi:indolepyruvate ferredoxin oxidoreductase beta subunit
VNLEALHRGREWIDEARRHEGAVADSRGPETATAPRAPAPVAPARTGAPEAFAPYDVRLEITPQWCKSCDICVKLCPERCLRLNDERVVELTDPAKCTGCRLCEWLCPDFAIRVHLDPVDATAGAQA